LEKLKLLKKFKDKMRLMILVFHTSTKVEAKIDLIIMSWIFLDQHLKC